MVPIGIPGHLVTFKTLPEHPFDFMAFSVYQNPLWYSCNSIMVYLNLSYIFIPVMRTPHDLLTHTLYTKDVPALCWDEARPATTACVCCRMPELRSSRKLMELMSLCTNLAIYWLVT